MRIEAFVFDLDGVITDTAELHYIAWSYLAAGLGISIDRGFNESLKGIGRLESLERVLAHGGRAADFTAQEKAALAKRKNDEYVRLVQQIRPSDILPGVERFVRSVLAAGHKTAVASASGNAAEVLRLLGLSELFRHVVDAATVQHGKPHPEIFLKAADYLGVAPENCVGIEDAAAGVQAVLGAGMFCVGIGRRDVLAGAHIVLGSTAELDLERITREASTHVRRMA
ncbi:MAG: beta-phosphoglucomutase [Defluviitaleaceae bacterium]|nr:beta-phosphoglucomutase [Defluviitaleaceae bacterium]